MDAIVFDPKNTPSYIMNLWGDWYDLW
jgi:hypothetical protein